MNVMASWVLVMLLAIGGIAFVLSASTPIIDQAKSAVSVAEAENTMAQLHEIIEDVSEEGIGSSRTLAVPAGQWSLKDGVVEYRADISSFDPLTRVQRGDVEIISGADTNCREGAGSYVLENSYLNVEIQKISGNVDTKDSIISIKSKAAGKTIAPTDSSIIIDSTPSTSSGTGTSELISTPHKCIVHYFIDSLTLDYDLYYTLYAGADFLVVDVRNIK